VKSAEVIPWQIVGSGPSVMVSVGFTVIEKLVEYTGRQLPLCTSALYSHVPPDVGVSEYVGNVFEIVDHEPEFNRFSQLNTLPVLPFRVNVPVDAPSQIGVELPLIHPATVVASTVTAVIAE